MAVLPRSIVVGFDFSDASRRALEWARVLSGRLGASVIVVHVDTDPLEQSGAVIDRARIETKQERERRLRATREELQREVDSVLGQPPTVRVRITEGRAAEQLEAMALELEADLIVVATSGKNAVERVLLGSTTQELVRRCPLPVLTVR